MMVLLLMWTATLAVHFYMTTLSGTTGISG